MTRRLDNDTNIPLRSPLHRLPDLLFGRSIDNILRETTDSAALLLVMPSDARRNARIIGEDGIADTFWPGGVIRPEIPLVFHIATVIGRV